jgi:hypothetical protein
MSRMLLITALMYAPVLCAQNIPVIPYESIYTPEIHLGSATEPSTITVPPVVEVTSQPAEPQVSNAPPASTALLATRHFDFITSPLDEVTPGSMEDTSISLGDYARQLRAQRQQAAANRTAPATTNPHSMAEPAKRQ